MEKFIANMILKDPSLRMTPRFAIDFWSWMVPRLLESMIALFVTGVRDGRSRCICDIASPSTFVEKD